MFWWVLAAVCAFFIKGLCGFANTLIFTSILSFHSSNVSISPVELLLGYPTNLILAWKERHSIRWGVCLPMAALVIAGSIPGILLLKNTDTGILKIIFGVVTVLISGEMLLREIGLRKDKQSKVILAVIGVLSGIMCGLYGVGALLGAYMSRVTGSSSAFKANICAVFVAENTLRIILYARLGIITANILKQSILLAPFMLLGLVGGMLSARMLNEKIVKKCVIILLIFSGMALIINSL